MSYHHHYHHHTGNGLAGCAFIFTILITVFCLVMAFVMQLVVVVLKLAISFLPLAVCIGLLVAVNMRRNNALRLEGETRRARLNDPSIPSEIKRQMVDREADYRQIAHECLTYSYYAIGGCVAATIWAFYSFHTVVWLHARWPF